MIYNYKQLELDQVLLLISSFSKTEEGRNFILNKREILPLEEIYKIHKLINLFENFEEKDIWESANLKYLLEPLKKNYEHIYNEKDTYKILNLILNFEGLREDLKKLEDPLIEEMEKRVFPPEPLKKYLNLFEKGGFLKKDATENLKKLYKDERLIFSQIQKQLEKEIEIHKNYLSGETFMYREERYCLPVKKVYQNKVEGVFWGISSSGETSFIEPTSLLKLNNLYKKIINEIELEKLKICAEISKGIKNYIKEIEETLNIIYEIDFYRALGNYKNETKGILPQICPTNEGINLLNTYHPLLLWMKIKRGAKAIPLNLSLRPPKRGLILTGPNGGGKTIALKTIGLALALGLMGFPINSGEGTKINHIENLFISIGDSQDLEKGLSTFTSMISDLAYFIREAKESSFILIDEIGFGTNPEEGSALGLSILKNLVDKNSYVIGATHLSYIKFLPVEDERFLNGSMGYDEKTGLPTFQFLKDIPGSSNAIKMAEMFGLPKEVIEKAKVYLDKKILEMDKLIEKLQWGIRENEEQRLKLQEEREKERASFEKKKEDLEKEKIKIREEFEAFKREFWEKLNGEIQKLRREGIKIGKKREEKLILNLTPNKNFEEKKEHFFEFKEGNLVFHKILKKSGIIKRIEGNIAVVEMGGKSFWTNIDQLEPHKEDDEEYRIQYNLKEEDFNGVLNLIGKRVEDAEEEIEFFLNSAFKKRVKKVQIIHGHGTGRLKKGIREYLKKQPYVSNFYPDERDGATWVELSYE